MSGGRAYARLATPLIIVLLCCGCSSKQKSGRPDIDETPKAELYGASTKASLYELRAKVRKRGAAAAKQDLPDLLESLESYEKQPVGKENHDTYKQIVEKLRALKTTLEGSPAKDALIKAVDEIGTLAAKLPGTANENPVVE